ncbi:MAG TPA: flagellar motor switch protein FliM [Syntrophales bacterium]|nr:flagellar motor switch protein FliM [Syntrophales bacterium]HOM06902.1 flagellar motor switch protein FliM [Syntrophales bacterium]HON99419.1 flagellar motor switch protein FliM [Syntrophales bacterium]HPC00544.1 flagellar motor switch protein FliM [Syntrophales bacterium]HPQ06443.1 flagellar motor switch protein FliM [Syntrophales bacterium]
MNRILTQEEVDALLRGISGGEIETETEDLHDPSEVVPYDLTSQDRIIRGRMPTLEMMNEKFARLFRATLTSLLRKVTSVTAISIDMIKFGEFLKTLPVPTSMHLFRIEPLRGTSLFVVEAKVIFMLVDILFGGTGRDTFKVEGREFTAIENNIIRRVVINALADLEKTWKGLTEVSMVYQRSEVNPQFVQIVSPTDVVVVVNFEVEVEYSSGLMTLCIPYASLEPLREKLQAGFQSEELEVDRRMIDRFVKNFMKAEVEVVVELGSTQLSAGEVVRLQRGDIIPLDQPAGEPLPIYIEGVKKFAGFPGVYKGAQAVQIAEIIYSEED